MNTSMERIHRQSDSSSQADGRDVKLGYLIAWLLGVPASVLMLVYFIRGS
jgi:hypothetical protein